MDLTTVEALARPTSRAELPAPAAGDLVLAGGTWVFSAPQEDARRLIDVTALGWEPLELREEGLVIGATCTLAELAALESPAQWPALGIVRACCDALRGSFKVWNAGTVGGNVCLALPAAPMTSLTAGLDGVATIWTADGGERELPVAEFVTGANANALRPGELLRSITLPAAALTGRAAIRQESLTPLGRSAALLVGRVDEGGAFELTVTASVPRPVRLSFPKVPSAHDLAWALVDAIPTVDFFDDVHGDPRWRRHLTEMLAEELRRELSSGGAR